MSYSATRSSRLYQACVHGSNDRRGVIGVMRGRGRLTVTYNVMTEGTTNKTSWVVRQMMMMQSPMAVCGPVRRDDMIAQPCTVAYSKGSEEP